MPFISEIQEYKMDFIQSLSGMNIEKTKPGTVVKIPYHREAHPWNIVRKES
jgi:hypothetical protein